MILLKGCFSTKSFRASNLDYMPLTSFGSSEFNGVYFRKLPLFSSIKCLGALRYIEIAPSAIFLSEVLSQPVDVCARLSCQPNIYSPKYAIIASAWLACEVPIGAEDGNYIITTFEFVKPISAKNGCLGPNPSPLQHKSQFAAHRFSAEFAG